MKPFQELALTKGYWLTKIQNDLYGCVEEYLKTNNLTRTQLADQLKVTKGYVSQVLNGDFDHRLSKLIELSLAVGVVPNIKFQIPEEYIENYISGYDHCINEKYVKATITVNNQLTFPSDSSSYDESEAETFVLVDRETEISFHTSKETAYEYVEY